MFFVQSIETIDLQLSAGIWPCDITDINLIIDINLITAWSQSAHQSFIHSELNTWHCKSFIIIDTY